MAAVVAVRELAEDISIPKLSALGVKESDIPSLAQEAFNDPQTIGNSRNLTGKLYEEIYRRAL